LKVSNELSLAEPEAEPEAAAPRRPRAKKAAAVDTDELLENFELDV
jgi:hypothetical protein